jgi:hypothetical protein
MQEWLVQLQTEALSASAQTGEPCAVHAGAFGASIQAAIPGAGSSISTFFMNIIRCKYRQFRPLYQLENQIYV